MLPDKTEVKAFCQLSRKQAALYQQAVKGLSEQLEDTEGIRRKGLVLSSLMRFKQICNHPSQWLGDGAWAEEDSGKWARLRELCEVIAAKQEKALVFTQFRQVTAPLASFLGGVFGRPGLVLHGETGVKKRQDLVRQFQEDEPGIRLRLEDPQGKIPDRPEMASVSRHERKAVLRGRGRNHGIPGAQAGREPVLLDVDQRAMTDAFGQRKNRKGKVPHVTLDDHVLPLVLGGLKQFHVSKYGNKPFRGIVDEPGRPAVSPLHPNQDVRVEQHQRYRPPRSRSMAPPTDSAESGSIPKKGWSTVRTIRPSATGMIEPFTFPWYSTEMLSRRSSALSTSLILYLRSSTDAFISALQYAQFLYTYYQNLRGLRNS